MGRIIESDLRKGKRIPADLLEKVSLFVKENYWGEVVKCYYQMAPGAAAPSARENASLKSELESLEPTFSEELLRLIAASGEKESVIYTRAHIDRRLFSKIRHDPHYQPTKATAIAFALALRLDMKDCQRLLHRAGFSLTHSSRSDTIIAYFIKSRLFDLNLINDALFDFGEETLGT